MNLYKWYFLLMKKIFLFILSFLFIITFSYADEANTSSDVEDDLNIIENIENWSWFILTDSWSEDVENIEDEKLDLVTNAIKTKKDELEKIIEKSAEDKDIDYIKWLLQELELKKDLNSDFIKEIKEDINSIQTNIENNEAKIKEYEDIQNKNVEINLELSNLKRENQKLKQDVFFKQSLINDLNDSLDSYKILEVKYNNVLDSYVKAKKEKQSTDLDALKKKLDVFYIWAILFFLVYLFKIFIKHFKIIKKNRTNFFVYFDLLYAIFLILFIIVYLFYAFPQLYILLIFVSWSIIWANAVLISSFVCSIIIFKKFKVGEVLKIDWDFWRIIKITPISIIVRRINEYWILETEEISIPNINLIKDKISVIKDLNEKDHHFSIIIPLKNDFNIFKIVDFIKENILLKNIIKRPETVDLDDPDLFKTKYEQVDSENIKISFFWVWSDLFNRKIEKKIIWYLESLFNYKETDNKEEK